MIAEFSNVLFFGSTAADAAVTSRPCGSSVFGYAYAETSNENTQSEMKSWHTPG